MSSCSNDIVFCGGGFSGLWYSVQYAHTYIRKEESYNICGYSSGIITACIVTFQIPRKKFYSLVYEIFNRHKYCFNFFKILEELTPFLEKLIPENAIEILNSNKSHLKLHLLLTDLKTLKIKKISSWSSRQELIECITTSCFIPCVTNFSFYSPMYFAIDGGIASDLPKYLSRKHIVIAPTLSLSTWVTQFYPSMKQIKIYTRLGQIDGDEAKKHKRCKKYNYDMNEINPRFYYYLFTISILFLFQAMFSILIIILIICVFFLLY